MANNLDVKDASGVTKTLKATDNGGVLTPCHNVDSLPADPFGANADSAVITDASGSISGKLRGLVKWAFERMPASLGQKAKTASFPVVLASDQNALPVTDNSGSLTVDGTVTAAASENHIGEFGRRIATISATPVVSSGTAYAVGDAIGTLMSFANAVRVAAGSGVIRTLVLADKAKQFAEMDLLLFEANPGGTTVTDNEALVVADADLLTCVGHIPITADDYVELSDNALACVRDVGLSFKLPSGTTLYGVLVARGIPSGVPTYVSTSDLVARLVVEQN